MAIGAAVDIGSNSVHLLVADVGNGGPGILRPPAQLRDESLLLGLGDTVDRDGTVSAPLTAHIAAALTAYRDVARGLGAQSVTFVATEPLRRATNGHQVAAILAAATGLPVTILDERQEGLLTFLGVVPGGRVNRTQLVVDVGGGSTEVVLASRGRAVSVTSLAIGSSRLSNGIVVADPPTPDEYERLRAAAGQAVGRLADARPEGAVLVGGTATNLARLAPLDAPGLGALDAASLAHARSVLLSIPAAEVVARFAVNLRRARQLAAGAAIVEALLDHYRLGHATVSQASLREGAIIAATRLGAGWPARLEELVAPAQSR